MAPLLWRTIILALVGFGQGYTTRIEEQFEKCCQVGTAWANEDLRCEKFSGPVVGVPALEQGMCLETVDICCVRAYHEKNCEKGKKDAREGLACIKTSNAHNCSSRSDVQRDCCEGCKLGILTGSLGQKCAFKSFSFGKPWDPAFLECCHETTSTVPTDSSSTVTTANTTTKTTTGGSTSDSDIFPPITDGNLPTPVVDDICQLMKDLLCSDICVPTVGSYYCACPEGKILLEDGKTCRTDGPPDRCDLDNPCEHRCTDTGTVIKCECDRGFNLAKDGHSCELEVATTTSTTPRYRPQNQTKFKCPPGYKYNSSIRVCDDVDECAEKLDSCGSQVCYNQPGGYSCADAPKPITEAPAEEREPPRSTVGLQKCQEGFKYVQNRGCIDVNECTEIEDACSSNEDCLNTGGSYSCACRVGFRRDNFTQACVDINECQLLQNDCLPTQRCDNTLGSYNCVRFLPCGTGYTLNAATEICEDDDECILGTHDCSDGYHCRNTLGSYRCDRNLRGQIWTTRPTTTSIARPITTTTTTTTIIPTIISVPTFASRIQEENPCPSGFMRTPDNRCQDINECQTRPCRAVLERCVNTVGSFRCVPRVVCGPGWKLDLVSGRCQDVNECDEGNHECHSGQTCENRQGGYVCSCPAGHALGPNRDCIDIDECSVYSSNICGTYGRCENTVGSYKCVCERGFESLPGSSHCRDIDECASNRANCQHSCVNVWGGYQCTCKPGYRLKPDNRSCSDIDECQEFKDNNLCVGLCDNTPGSYVCRCPDGYRLGDDLRTCQDIDECASGGVCREPSEMCQNTRGGFRCNRINCPPGYQIDPTRRNRCVRTSRYCPSTDIACLRSPSHFSFNFITFVSMLPIPQTGQLELFTMKGTHLPSSIVRFSMALVEANAPPGVMRVTESFFALRRPTPSQAVLVLTRSIAGPQEISLELTMEIYHNTAFMGSAVAKLLIIVTQYEF